MAESRFAPVCRVVKAHGLRGEVSVIPLTDLPFALPAGLRLWIVPPPAGGREVAVESVRPGPKGPLLKLSGINDVSTAQTLSGRQLLALAEDLPADWQLQEPDPVGLEVRLEDGERLGEVSDVISTGANDVWVVRGQTSQVLLPVIPDVVVRIDYEARCVVVRLLPGLLD